VVAALLSISVGIMNLLPIPPLDGGQMMVALAEMVRGGRRLSMRVQTAVANVGFTLVVVLIMSVLFVDFKRYALPDKNPTVVPTASPSASPQ
jgi:regulator of sigma E protease